MTVPTHLLWLVISAFICIPVSCVYFPLPSWHVRVPFNFSINRSLLRLVAVRSAEDEDGIDWMYSIDTINPPLLKVQVDPQTGNVFLNSLISPLYQGQNFSLTLSARNKVNNMKLATSTGLINITQWDSSICKNPTEQACFLPVPYNMNISENLPEQVIANLAYLPYRSLCQSNVRYTINQDVSQFLSVNGSTGDLKTNVQFDRETISKLNFTISCTVPVNGEKRKFYRSGCLKVLDVNDNPPMLPNGDRVEFNWTKQLRVGSSLPLSSDILIKDLDKIRSEYTIKVIGDEKGFFDIELVDKNLIADAIYRKAVVKVKKPFEFEGETYPMTIIFEDENMSEKYGNRTANLDLVIINSYSALNFTISSRYNVSINSNAAKYTKILGPFLMHLGKQEPEYTFSIDVQQPKLKGVINVTPLHGIVYLQDPTILAEWSNFTVQLKWILNSDSNVYNFTQVDINILPSINPNQCDGATSCAFNKNEIDCINTCGQGSGQGTCHWLKSTTCVPNTATCSDGECDELEKLDWKICPQDCIEKKYVVPPHCIGGEHRTVFGFGVFWCDSQMMKCHCFPSLDVENYDESSDRNKKSSTMDDNSTWIGMTPGLGHIANVATVESDMKCDTRCAIFIALGVGLPIVFSLLFLTWYIRRLKTRAGRPKYLGSAMSLSAVPSDYVDERSSSVVSQAISVTDTLLMGAPKLHVPIDSRWEFPRNQLIIEQTLGEGEFGRVMRAKAFGIDVNPGFLTVAVKMLKNNGTNTELQDLLSEYNLLKEVSHQNVIKLLGACTDKGGPFYIIVEYAELGSLRNYLRKSRQLEFDTYTSEDSGVGSLLLAPSSSGSRGYQVSPRDLLSFMWQISKGMAYLSDMKVIHRDLATRNVLIAADKVVKISDFGLSRDVYEGDAYFKKSKGRVPVKWMAIESLINHIYTSKSDVWSFGVVMWEIVMLGSTPYPGVQPERLFYLLKSGYRMEKPDNCSDELYKLMTLCWKDNPHERPHFRELTSKLDVLLQDNVEYLDLGFNIIHNMTYFEDHQDDIEDEDSDSEDHDYGSLNALPDKKTPEYRNLNNGRVKSDVAGQTFILPVASTSWSPDSNSVVIAEAVV